MREFLPLAVSFFGIFLLFVSALWWLMGRGLERKIAREVEERTHQLEVVSRRYRLMADNAWDLIAITKVAGDIEYANSGYMRVLGYAREALKNRNLMDLVHPRDVESLRHVMLEVASGKPAAEIVIRCRHADGRWVHLEAIAKGLPDPDWMVRSLVIHARDISARKAAADDLARSEQRFRDFAASSADWLWEVDAQRVFTYVSPGVNAVLGFEPADMIGRNQLDALFDDENDPTRELIDNRMQRNQPYRDLEFWTKDHEGARVCLRMSGVAVFDDMQVFKGYRGAASNITASKVDREHMFRMATTDHLTGLLNRVRFKEELDRSVGLSRRHHTSGVILFIDLDRFKEINDSHGHEAGDRILVEVANILREAVRSTDIVARLGGDEFGIIMHNIDVPTATEKVERIIERVGALGVDYNGVKLTTTMSIGMVQYPQEDKGPDHLIMSADLAMYRAKDMGRNRLFVDESDATEETKGSVREQLKWVDRLKVCLENEDFEMHYQCLVPAQPRQRPLFEALLRIYDENGKVGSPALYIDAAEHFGLIQQLDLAVVKKVFETQQQLQAEGIGTDVTINLSCRTLGDPEVADRLEELMHMYQIDPNRIIFEVTETMALHDPAQMRDIGEIHAFMTDLRKLGFRFALDDFGTGFTSFRYLKVLDVDVVKIDGEYVRDLLTSAEDRLFVRSMVELCQGLGIQTVAEFVENEQVMKVLCDLGIDYGQGWHFAKPGGDIRALVRKYHQAIMRDFNLPMDDMTEEKLRERIDARLNDLSSHEALLEEAVASAKKKRALSGKVVPLKKKSDGGAK